MSSNPFSDDVSMREMLGFFITILGPERKYYVLATVYGLGISFLSLALPISVQMLVNTVVQTGLTLPLIALTLTLFGLLFTSGLLNALRIHLMDLFARRFYSRMMAEVTLRAIYALNPFFQDQNMISLFNRYFDILIGQRTVPYLLVGGFTILLQAAVGFILVSLYHPLFLAFNLVNIGLIWLIWIVWGGPSIRSAVMLSHKKHAAAAWLDGLGASNGFFKSERHIEEALTRSDDVTDEYITAHRRHFRNYFSQILGFLFLYAFSSASLLGLGGWLVIEDDLTLGQLVAAELVLSVVFYGLSQLGSYLAYFYELCGALDELALFYRVEQEDPDESAEHFTGDARIEFVNARGEANGQSVTFNFNIPSGARVLAAAESHGLQREINSLIKRHGRAAGGYIAVGGHDILGIQPHELRQQVIVLARPNAIEMSIREYLALSGGNPSSVEILDALKIVGMEPTLRQLENGLDTRISTSGWPLSITETMQMKLAAAIIAKPRVLVLAQIFDTLTDECLQRSLDYLQAHAPTTVIYFSSRPRDLGCTHYLYVTSTEQTVYDSLPEFASRMAQQQVAESAGLPVTDGSQGS